MFGGHYVITSDSRFNDAVAKLLEHSFYGAVRNWHDSRRT